MEFENDGGGIVQRTTEYTFSSRDPASGTGDFPATEAVPNATEEVIFLEPGQERAQNIVKAMSHQNAGDVVQLLSQDGSLQLSDIATRLNISLNSVKYHIDNLMDAGILEVSNTRYSVKGRKIKVYRLKNQVFIVAPKMTSISEVRTALMKYSALLVVFISVFCVALVQSFVEPAVDMALAASLGSTLSAGVMNSNGIVTALITATAVTLLLLVIYEINIHWINPKSSA